ncbi:hypothetical protein BWZ22_09755 [Seonamhaeicola sp. S2-3]|uniref:hypothetical protein n=1 Tax=Seonamhaeicola sp. S2-3 TaxID=1936081 RepID=UPI000972BB3F|nr:hypothetical protein [Seonamhaeicola sp. S2-3]APY11511.1 hypothetical protein BWZ22_09755 [Seonamhaeicola sp. S2-3]
MEAATNQSLNKSFRTRQGQDTNKHTQLKTIFKYLHDHIATNSMVAKATGVPQKNICRYKRILQKMGVLVEVKKAYCQATNHLAWYLSTNPKYHQQSNQLSLF